MWSSPSEVELLEISPVPYVGDEKMNPHNELLSSDDGIMLLDIPDRNNIHGKQLAQVGDLFAQIESAQ